MQIVANYRRGVVHDRRHGGTAAIAAALVLLSACGNDDTDVGAGEPVTVPTSDVTTAPATGTDDIDLDAVMLTTEDLPGGWSEVPTTPLDGSDGSCLDALGAPGGPFDVEVARTTAFAAGELGPFLAAALVDAPADEVLAEVDEILAACDDSTSAGGFTTTIEPAAIEGLPGDSLSVHGSDEDAAGGGVDLALVATGSSDVSMMVFAVTPLGEIDDAVVASAIDAMWKRLPT